MRFLSLIVGLVLALGVGLAAPQAARAVELEPGFATTTIWSDNVFFGQLSEDSDVSIRLSPRLRVIDRDGAVTWNVLYSPSYEYYKDFSDLRGFDHSLDGTTEWQITRRTKLTFRDRFVRHRSIRRLNETDPLTATPDSFARRERFIRNIASVELSHLLTPRHVLSLNAQHYLWDFSREEQADFEIRSATLSYNYLFDARTRLGIAGSWRNRSLERDAFDATPAFDQETDFYTLSLTVQHRFDRRWNLNVSAGPAIVEGASPFEPPTGVDTLRLDPPAIGTADGAQLVLINTCPVLPDGRPYLGQGCEASGLPANFLGRQIVALPFNGPVPTTGGATTTFFAAGSLVRTLQNGEVSLGFRRSEDQSTTTGSSGVSTTVSLDATYRPTTRWRWFARASYQIRDQAVEQSITVVTLQPLPAIPVIGLALDLGTAEVDRDDDIETIRASVGAEYRWNQRTRMTATVFYLDQEQSLGGTVVRDSDRISVWLGLTYDFEPIHLRF